MSLTLVLFLIGVLGFVFNRKNIILMLISIEIMLLSITFLILVSSINLDDIIGQTYAVYIIVVAGAESAIGLAILVAFYRLTSLKSTRLSFSYSKLPIKSINSIPLLHICASYKKKITNTAPVPVGCSNLLSEVCHKTPLALLAGYKSKTAIRNYSTTIKNLPID